jgi:glycosyltransferase involved in cell wall biosynthesis
VTSMRRRKIQDISGANTGLDKMHENRQVILIPCLNEEVTIRKVINDFSRWFDKKDIYVYDNGSDDDTYNVALEEGVNVCMDHERGKGNVIRSMFRQIDADLYILVDGDDTYPAEAAVDMADLLMKNDLDMVVGDRIGGKIYREVNTRRFHYYGNLLISSLITKLFRVKVTDVLSGFRVFSKRFAKNVPILSNGFSVEVEMTLFCIDRKLRMKEVAIEYRDRPEGSHSKLNTFADGFLIIRTIFRILKDYKPLLFFSMLSLLFFLSGAAVGTPVIIEFVRTGLVFRVSSAILATGLMLISIMSLFVGLILDTIVNSHRELFEMNLKR